MKKITILFITCLFVLFSSVLFADAEDVAVAVQDAKSAGPIQFLYADMDNTKKRDATDPLLIMAADDYRKIFGEVPLERMLRTQINNKEYIVLDQEDLDHMDKNKTSLIDNRDGYSFYKIYFAQVSGTIKGSYIVTTAKMMNFGKLKEILLDVHPTGHTKVVHEGHDINEVDEVDFENNKEINVRTTEKKSDKDMPWMGL